MDKAMEAAAREAGSPCIPICNNPGAPCVGPCRLYIKRVITAADKARTVMDEEMRGALWDGWTEIQRHRIVADLHAAGFKVIRG